jgi:hypothetical protein
MMLIMALISVYQSITRPLVESDWERFDFYAKRIRHLKTHSKRPGTILDISVFRIIQLSCRPLPLLPNLQHLDALSSGDHTLWNVAPLLGPKLKHFSLLSLGTGGSSALEKTSTILARTSVLASLKVYTPFLEYLEVSGKTKQLSSVISGTVCSLQHLRVLKLGTTALTPECINHLPTMSNLADLEVTIARDSVMHAASTIIWEASFPALRALVILTELWATVDAFFEAYLQPSSLVRVEFQVDQTPTNEHFHQLFTTMRKCCSLGSLTGIILRPQIKMAVHIENDDSLLSQLVLDPNTLHMLFAFANLEVLRIKTFTSFAKVDNALIKDMALAWPGLKSLEIRHSPTSRHSTSVTIHGLLPLASCSSLKQLSINIDPTTQDALPQLRQGQGNTSLCLVDLALGKPPIGNPYAVASFLSDVFPLANIHAKSSADDDDYDYEDESIKCWTQVKYLFDQSVKFRIREKWAETPDRNMYVCPLLAVVKLCCVHYSCPAQCVARSLNVEVDSATGSNKGRIGTIHVCGPPSEGRIEYLILLLISW